MPQRVGRYTLSLETAPVIAGYASVVGKKEGAGPLAKHFDKIYDDTTLGLESWEKAESELLKEAVQTAMDKAGVVYSDVDYVFAGDLLNQCISSTYGIRDMNIPFIGVYGACSTMALSLGLAGCFVDAGLASTCSAATSSHFCSAERQFRFPLEYGSQRTPTSQWTVTGAGSAVVRNAGHGVRIQKVCFGQVVDLGVSDINNMGAAMAPAAAQTIQNFLSDTGTLPDDYDMILTGDLGAVGSKLLEELLNKENIDISKQHTDCGLLIYNPGDGDINAGASGCGCSASVLCSYILKRMEEKMLKNILFCATGALMSPTSNQQGETIPGVAHLVHLVCPD